MRTLIKKILPIKFVKHYIRPFFIRKQSKYNAKKYWNSWYKATLKNKNLSDADTIGPLYNKLKSYYHYNEVENQILLFFIRQKFQKNNKNVLDIGSGNGHWVNFYRHKLGVKEVTGVDISEPCIRSLKAKYKNNKHINFVTGDIGDERFELNEKFDIVNAIGVFFHIVDDVRWEKGIENISRHLREGGVAIIGGEFGLISRNIQFHNKDNFSSWKEMDTFRDKFVMKEKAFCNKKIRSRCRWVKTAKKYGFKKEVILKSKGELPQTIENNIIIFRKKSL